jgi:hypothetical protein
LEKEGILDTATEGRPSDGISLWATKSTEFPLPMVSELKEIATRVPKSVQRHASAMAIEDDESWPMIYAITYEDIAGREYIETGTLVLADSRA